MSSNCPLIGTIIVSDLTIILEKALRFLVDALSFSVHHLLIADLPRNRLRPFQRGASFG
jgi:hypothetical protein